MDEVEEYIKRLKDEEWYVRSNAARALGRLGDPRAVAPLIRALGDESIDLYSAWALRDLGYSQAIDPLIKALGDGDAKVRGWAAYVLGELGDACSVKPLIIELVVKDSDVRRKAVKALSQALRDGNLDVQASAAVALGKLGDLRGIAPLSKALGEKEECVQEQAASALTRLPDMRVVPALGNYYEKHLNKEKAKKLLREVIDRLAPLQRENMQCWPNLVCTTCYKRPIVKKMKIGFMKSLKYAACPQCGTSALARDIREVVGVVDRRTGHEVNDDILYVQLWDNTAQECVYADIDRLEIRQAAGLRYDIIVNKLILTLHDRSGWGQDYLSGIPVQFRGNPDIPLGTRSLLEQKFQEVTE